VWQALGLNGDLNSKDIHFRLLVSTFIFVPRDSSLHHAAGAILTEYTEYLNMLSVLATPYLGLPLLKKRATTHFSVPAKLQGTLKGPVLRILHRKIDLCLCCCHFFSSFVCYLPFSRSSFISLLFKKRGKILVGTE
jgi:hypothetical protein